MMVGDISENKVKCSNKPPKLIYCSDGVLEEYSDSDDDFYDLKYDEDNTKINVNPQKTAPLDVVDAKQLTWVPWLKHYAAFCASKGLSACDFMGEKLAWWLGITKPKYLYEIEEYNRMKQEIEEQNDADYDFKNIEMNTVAYKDDVNNSQIEIKVTDNNKT